MASAAGAPPGRLQQFVDRYPLLGPAVWVLSIIYFAAQLATAWVWHPAYSVVRNTISDLGNTTCGDYRGSFVCSPRHELMNAAFIAVGVVMAAGSLLIATEFTEGRLWQRRTAALGFWCIAAAGLGSIAVGLFPENTVRWIHILGATLAIGVANVGILLLGIALPLPTNLRRFMLTWAPISLVALACFACDRDFGIGTGSMERLAAYPVTIWLVSFGVYMMRDHYTRAARARTTRAGARHERRSLRDRPAPANG